MAQLSLKDTASTAPQTGPASPGSIRLRRHHLPLNPIFDTTYTEYRGDGPTRTFNYTRLHLHRFPDDSCPTRTLMVPADQQFLLNYTDFQGNTTILGYDPQLVCQFGQRRQQQYHLLPARPTSKRLSGPKRYRGNSQNHHPGGAHIDYTYKTKVWQYIGTLPAYHQ